MKLAILQPFSTPIWLPAGGAIAAFIIFGYRVWPAVFIGSFLGHVSTIGLVSTSFIVSAGATLEGLAGAYLVNKFAHGVKAFETAKDVLLFVLFACICAPLIDVAVGFGVSSFGGRIQSTDSTLPVFAWWLAHGIFVLLVAPFLIMLFGTPHHRLNLREFGELTVLLLGLLFVCLLVFGPLSLTLNKDQVIQGVAVRPILDMGRLQVLSAGSRRDHAHPFRKRDLGHLAWIWHFCVQGLDDFFGSFGHLRWRDRHDDLGCCRFNCGT